MFSLCQSAESWLSKGLVSILFRRNVRTGEVININSHRYHLSFGFQTEIS